MTNTVETQTDTMAQIPVIDVSSLFMSPSLTSPEARETIAQIHSAFTTWGVFLLTGTHTISPSLNTSLRSALEAFFSLSQEKKDQIHLRKGGWAWRGYMPWGGEGSGGNVDQKEGFYGGPEPKPGVDGNDGDPLAGLPTYGRNQFPDAEVPELRGLVLEYIDKVTELGMLLGDAISAGLGLGAGHVRDNLLSPEPVQLFRAFRYSGREGVGSCGIGEHSDFGFLTILSQNAAGLQVLSPRGEWVDVPVVPDSFVVNGECLSVPPQVMSRSMHGNIYHMTDDVSQQSATSSTASRLACTSPRSTASCRPRPSPTGSPSRSSSTPPGRQRWRRSPWTTPPTRLRSSAGSGAPPSTACRASGASIWASRSRRCFLTWSFLNSPR